MKENNFEDASLYEQSLEVLKRSKYGIFYTKREDILKIVKPIIVEFWEQKMMEPIPFDVLIEDFKQYKVLDPACGCGNFLVVALEELEKIRIKLELLTKKEIDFDIKENIFGIDVDEKALNIASRFLKRKNLLCRDALFTKWPKVNAIIGNPPFLGGSKIRSIFGDEYKTKLKKRFPQVNGKADICCFWFVLAHKNLPYSGRAGFVATNSISQNNSRESSLKLICNSGGKIFNAITSFKWSGEANVHVSIVNWVKGETISKKLNERKAKTINCSLIDGLDVSEAKELKANAGLSFQGVIINGKGFEVTPEQAKSWIEKDAKNKEVLKPFVGGDTLSRSPNGEPKNWVIDFNQMSLEEASEHELPFNWVVENVKPERQTKKDEKLRNKWWLFAGSYKGLRSALEGISCYFGIIGHAKWSIPILIKKENLIENSCFSITSEDLYVLGILTSDAHRQWVKAQGSTLKSDTRYTPKTCFRTFPFPQVNEVVVDKIRQAAIELHEYRYEQMEKQWGITTLYNKYFDEPESQLYKLHKKLDTLVLEAYGFSPDDDILEKLFLLNLELKNKEDQGEKVLGARDYRFMKEN